MKARFQHEAVYGWAFTDEEDGLLANDPETPTEDESWELVAAVYTGDGRVIWYWKRRVDDGG